MDSKIIQQNDILQDDALIEKHGNGKFEGFRFYPNKSSTDQTIDTQNLANDENLILAFVKRATRFCASANGDFTLSSDGIVRWTGQPVGKLIATEEFLSPRAILLADTQLTGEAHDKVVKRLERFITFHFETALKPLFDLRNADSLTDSTKGLAQKLINSLGIVPRREVADTVKNLDQLSRAVLRRLGVRFGAFHIYVAAMLKPAPVQAIMLLWNLQNEGHDQTGLNEILAALSAGRTSLVVDPAYNPRFYQLAGYRILGRRAVRVDILERLANLIRSAVNWKPGTEPKPDGAYDGKSFFSTPTMMSILGANGTDMEEILKGLGYQSHPCSSAVFDQNLLQSKSSIHIYPIEKSIPEAECVGDQWQTINASKVTEKDKALHSVIEKQPNSANCLPSAEPVGNFAKQKHNIPENKVILLWRYNHQTHHHSHKNRDKSEQGWKNKHKKTFKRERNANENTPAKTESRANYKSSKKNHKHLNNKSSQKEKQLNLDSPFAKLMELRNQLTKK
ncbi:hypothetical protein [Bartonella sp. CB189]|uniref:hypothetical protein n=1 Tax=Bartonella sp. CB189 TaxID=3112254 RepID=UPI002F962081